MSIGNLKKFSDFLNFFIEFCAMCNTNTEENADKFRGKGCFCHPNRFRQAGVFYYIRKQILMIRVCVLSITLGNPLSNVPFLRGCSIFSKKSGTYFTLINSGVFMGCSIFLLL
jgi:hypothetical protein